MVTLLACLPVVLCTRPCRAAQRAPPLAAAQLVAGSYRRRVFGLITNLKPNNLQAYY